MGEVGQPLTLITNHYSITEASSIPSTSTPTGSSSFTASHSTPTASCFNPTTSPFNPTGTASTLIIYRLTIAEEGKAQLDLPLLFRTKLVESLKESYPEVFEGRVLVCGPPDLAYGLDYIPDTRNTKYLVDESDRSGRERCFEMELKMQHEIPVEEVLKVLRDPPPTTPQQGVSIIKILESMLRYNLSLHYERRDEFFFPSCTTLPPRPITYGRKIQLGYSATLTHASSLFLSVDVCQPVVTNEQPLLAFMRTDLGKSESDFSAPLTDDTRYDYSVLLRNLKVWVTHSKVRRVYRVLEVAAQGADSILMYLFNPRQGNTTQMTIQEYFQSFYGISLIYPHLNCLHVAPKHRLIFLPMEVCMVAGGQNVTNRRGEWQDAKVDWNLCPGERQQYLSSLLRSPALTQVPCLAQLHLTLDGQAVRVEGRVLPPPHLLASSPVVPEGGRWVLGEGLTLYQPVYFHTWSVVQYDVDGFKKNIRHLEFIRRLIAVGKTLGMRMDWPSVDVVRKVTKPMDDMMSLEMYYPYMQLTVFLMRSRVPYLHEDTKHAGNVIMQRITQCIQPDTYRNKVNDDGVLRSILLQMNAKCGGVSVIVDWPSMLPLSDLMCRPVMVIGAAVNKPPHGSPRSAYITAMVGMMSSAGGQCATMVHAQHCHNFITNTAPNMRILLLRYYEQGLQKPESILLYRLDVPEELQQQVAAWEMEEIRKCCLSMQEQDPYQPPITYICVTRRHSTRLFQGEDRDSSVPPGTVVDTHITHPLYREFFLNSHPNMKGTNRPTHYRVLHDENNLTMDQLQTITYGLCHLHACCTNSISLPMPAAYARQASLYARQVVQRQECHVAKVDEPYDPVPLVTEAAEMDHRSNLHNTLYYL